MWVEEMLSKTTRRAHSATGGGPEQVHAVWRERKGTRPVPPLAQTPDRLGPSEILLRSPCFIEVLGGIDEQLRAKPKVLQEGEVFLSVLELHT